ncbi:hypothetical protein JCM10908_002788 [Rhodotorula pacifica]|uniref:uncharacterized protein n=1 Tax=Rhodotorula pacifica TaxID=1495444 RepID=UPI00317598AB
MKAGVFGRQPERRQVQPGGRVLPGMFAAGGPAKTAPSSPPPATTTTHTTAAREGSTRQEAVLSSWGGGGQGSGRLPPASNTTPSRLDRSLANGTQGSEAPAQPAAPSDSISRARRLGLNRAPRTPPPRTSLSDSDAASDERDGPTPTRFESSSLPARNRSPSPPPPRASPERSVPRESAQRSSSPPASEVPAAESAEEATTKPAPRPLPGLLSSLWNRASELVAGTAPATATAASSAESKEAGGTGEEHSDGRAKENTGTTETIDVAGDAPTQAKKPLARPVVVPALVAPALAGIAPHAVVAQDRPVRSAPELPPPEPITYHRPPALHPRGTHEEVPRFRSQPTPYDWLESRDESRLLPYLFMPTVAQAAAYEARLRSQASKAAAQTAASALGPAGLFGATTSPSSALHAHAPHAPPHMTLASHLCALCFLHTLRALTLTDLVIRRSPLAMVAASMPAYAAPQRQVLPEARPAASSQPLPRPVETRAPDPPSASAVSSGSAAVGGALAAGTVAGSTAVVPPLVQSAFASPSANNAAQNAQVGSTAFAPSSVTTAPAPPAATTGTAPSFVAAQPAPTIPAVPPIAYPYASGPPMEYLPRYVETEPAPRAASPATHTAQAEEPTEPVGASGVTAGRDLPSTSEPAAEVPRAGLGGDSLPVHPSPAQYSAGAALSSNAAAPSAVAPPSNPLPAISTFGAPAPTQATAPPAAQSQSQTAWSSAPPLAVPAPAPPVTSSAPTSRIQAPPPSLPPLVPPASFSMLQPPAAGVAVPMIAPIPTAIANTAATVPQDPALPSLGPTALLKGARTALKRAVLALDPAAPIAAGSFPSYATSAQRSSATAIRQGIGHGVTSAQEDLPPMPKPRPIATSALPLTHAGGSPQAYSLSASPVLVETSRDPPLSGIATAVATTHLELAAASAIAASSSPATSANLAAPHTLLNDHRISPSEHGRDGTGIVPLPAGHSPLEPQTSGAAMAETATPRPSASAPPYDGGTASVPSSRSTTPAASTCSSPATSLPAATSSPPPRAFKSPPLASLSPPPVPPRPASIPPLPQTIPPLPQVAVGVSPHEVRATVSPSAATREPSPTQEVASTQDNLVPAVTTTESIDAPRAASTTPSPPKPRVELQMLDLDLPDFGSSFSLATPVQLEAASLVPPSSASTANRHSTPSLSTLRPASRGAATPETSDPLDDAFEETTTFVAGFAQASLLRATIDPNHTGRTEKWLEQMGVRPRPVNEMGRPGEKAAPPVEMYPESTFRPRTAPPASIAPEMTYTLQASSPTPPLPVPAASISLPSPPKSTPSSYGGLRELRMSSLVADGDGAGSPLETSIGRFDSGTVLERARAVAPDFELRAQNGRDAQGQSVVTKPVASAPARPDNLPSAPLDPTSKEGGAPTIAPSGAPDFGALVGDKGETASEVAAMFANW